MFLIPMCKMYVVKYGLVFNLKKECRGIELLLLDFL